MPDLDDRDRSPIRTRPEDARPLPAEQRFFVLRARSLRWMGLVLLLSATAAVAGLTMMVLGATGLPTTADDDLQALGFVLAFLGAGLGLWALLIRYRRRVEVGPAGIEVYHDFSRHVIGWASVQDVVLITVRGAELGQPALSRLAILRHEGDPVVCDVPAASRMPRRSIRGHEELEQAGRLLLRARATYAPPAPRQPRSR